MMAASANSNPPLSPSAIPAASPNAGAAALSPRTGSSPWTQIVKGPESEVTAPPLMQSGPVERSNSPTTEVTVENAENGGNAGTMKPVWNKKPANGPVENGGPVPVVMGPAEAWPALSESTKASPKLSSSDSSKSPPDFGLVSPLQVTGIGSSSSSSIVPPVQSLSQSSTPSPKPTTSNFNHNSMSNLGRPARQKSMKRDGGGNPQANGGFSHQSSSPAEGLHSHNHTSTKTSSDSSGRDNILNHGHREHGSWNAAADHSQQRNSFRRGGGGSHSRSDGSHQNYGGRRGDQDRGNHDWNHQRSFNGRDSSMQPRVSPRGFVRAPTVNAPPFVHPAPIGGYMNPMGVPEVPVYYLPNGVSFVHAPVPSPVFIHPAVDPQLHAKIVNQIDYYFSNENLIKDTYLRNNMDDQGWVPVTLIANFKKVMQLTEDIQQILEALRSSTVVEVQGDKIRKCVDWEKWIMPPSVQYSTASGLQSPKSPTTATLTYHFRNVKIDEKSIDQNHSKGQLDDNADTSIRSSARDLPCSLQTGKVGESSSGC